MQKLTLGTAFAAMVLSLVSVGAIVSLLMQQGTLLETVNRNAVLLELLAERLPEAATSIEARDAAAAPPPPATTGEKEPEATNRVQVRVRDAAGQPLPVIVKARLLMPGRSGDRQFETAGVDPELQLPEAGTYQVTFTTAEGLSASEDRVVVTPFEPTVIERIAPLAATRDRGVVRLEGDFTELTEKAELDDPFGRGDQPSHLGLRLTPRLTGYTAINGQLLSETTHLLNFEAPRRPVTTWTWDASLLAGTLETGRADPFGGSELSELLERVYLLLDDGRVFRIESDVERQGERRGPLRERLVPLEEPVVPLPVGHHTFDAQLAIVPRGEDDPNQPADSRDWVYLDSTMPLAELDPVVELPSGKMHTFLTPELALGEGVPLIVGPPLSRTATVAAGEQPAEAAVVRYVFDADEFDAFEAAAQYEASTGAPGGGGGGGGFF